MTQEEEKMWENFNAQPLQFINMPIQLTERKFYAAVAMHSILSNAEKWKYKGKQITPEEVARLSVVSADALINELNCKPTTPPTPTI